MSDVLLIATSNNSLAVDFAAHCRRQERKIAVVAGPRLLTEVEGGTETYNAEGAISFLADHAHDRVAGIVVFLDRSASGREFEALAEVVRARRLPRVCIVSSFLVHFGDRKMAEVEARARDCFARAGAKVVVLRPAHVLSARTRVSRIGGWLAVLPESFRSCCVEGSTLFQVIEQELHDATGPRNRTFTLLGPNRPWRELAPGQPRVTARLARIVLHCLVPILTLAFNLVAKRRPALRAWNFDTLYPDSPGELLALYNKHNHVHVKVVGYNNGVVHFGQRFPGKTIVSTIRTARSARIGNGLAKFDAGITIRDASNTLRGAGKELHVLPNYSYVSLGTSYFVPIHGSACSFSTIGETIEKVVLYDPVQDRFIVTRRTDPDFSHYMYNLHADVLLLRLYIRVKDKSQYYVRQQELINPSSAEVIRLFHDEDASNVELRKAGARSRTVKVSRYYAEAPGADGNALEVPRDTLGSLWDRLEENRVTSMLFHGLTRRFAHHVELFLSESEFAVFWETHASLPIKKIQLRYIKRDGFPNSPFQKGDSISADLFMLKKHRGAFDAYLKETFGTVRMNPGKHSM